MDPQLEELIDATHDQTEMLDLIADLLGELTDASGAKKGPEKKDGGGDFFKELRDAAGSLAQMTAVAAGFTYAFNPSLVNQLGQTFAGLAATIGSILQPILEVAIPVIREVSGIILELANDLRPLIELLASSIGEVFVSVVRAAADVLASLMPVIEPVVKVLATLFNVLSVVINVLSALLRAILSTVGALLGISATDVADALETFRNLLYEAVRALAAFAAEALDLVGANETIAKFRDNLARTIDAMKKPKAGLNAAPTGATTGGIEDISRKFAEKAFTASAGAAAKKRDTELLELIHKDLEELIKNPGGLRARAAGAADALIRGPAGGGVAIAVMDASAVPPGAGRAADAVLDAWAAAVGGR